MFDARSILGQLLEAQQGRGRTQDRLGHALGPQGLGRGGNPLGDLLSNMLGGASGAGLGDLTRKAEEMMGAQPGAVRGTLQDKNQLAMGGLAALAGAVLGGRRGGMGGALGGGLLAMLGSLAFAALKNPPATAGTTAPAGTGQLEREVPLGLREPQTPGEETQLQNTALLALRAMIAAAKADGSIDGGEMSRILGKLDELGSDSEARDFVMNELQKPLDMDALVRDANTSELAVQVYGASLLAIDVNTDAEREYLKKLAAALGLDQETVDRVHVTLGVNQGAPAA
jgi:uncharacterized membrane protein YebE (DUF533 family)